MYCNAIIKHEFKEKFCNLKCKIKSHRNIVDDCWLWTGLVSGKYGRISFNRSHFVSHRASFLAFVGEIPDKNYVYHTCDNSLCMNPQHLFLDKAPYFKMKAKQQPEYEGILKKIISICNDCVVSIKDKFKMGVK
jgi:hypothetical protein